MQHHSLTVQQRSLAWTPADSDASITKITHWVFMFVPLIQS